MYLQISGEITSPNNHDYIISSFEDSQKDLVPTNNTFRWGPALISDIGNRSNRRQWQKRGYLA